LLIEQVEIWGKDLFFHAGLQTTGEEYLLRFIVKEQKKKNRIELIKKDLLVMSDMVNISPFFVNFVDSFEIK
jgi:hypothetical protein